MKSGPAGFDTESHVNAIVGVRIDMESHAKTEFDTESPDLTWYPTTNDDLEPSWDDFATGRAGNRLQLRLIAYITEAAALVPWEILNVF